MFSFPDAEEQNTVLMQNILKESKFQSLKDLLKAWMDKLAQNCD